MKNTGTEPRIVESLFEHRQIFATPWMDRWMTSPNPFVAALAPSLRAAGVRLADFSFNQSTANLGDIMLNIAIRRWSAAVRITLDSVTFVASNLSWGNAPQLADIFDQVSAEAGAIAGTPPLSQEASLLFHVTPGCLNFAKTTASLVNKSGLGEYLFYGLSLHRVDGVLSIDKSLRYEDAAFVRLVRTFNGTTPFADVARRLYEDEVAALRLLGIEGVP